MKSQVTSNANKNGIYLSPTLLAFLVLHKSYLSKTPRLSGIMNDSKAIFKAFVSSNHDGNVRIYSCVTHILTSAWIQKSTSPLVP